MAVMIISIWQCIVSVESILFLLGKFSDDGVAERTGELRYRICSKCLTESE